MGKSRYKLTGGKKNGFASFPKTLVEGIFWDKKKQPLEEVLDGKIDAPNDPSLAGKIPQVGQDGKIEWVDPSGGGGSESPILEVDWYNFPSYYPILAEDYPGQNIKSVAADLMGVTVAQLEKLVNGEYLATTCNSVSDTYIKETYPIVSCIRQKLNDQSLSEAIFVDCNGGRTVEFFFSKETGQLIQINLMGSGAEQP